MKISLAGLFAHFVNKKFVAMRSEFYEDFADAKKEDESLFKFLTIRKARAVKQKDPMVHVYSKLIQRMDREGGKLSYVLKGTVPDSDIMMLAAVEDKGDAEAGIRFLAKTITDQEDMAAAMKSAVLMPAVVAVIMLIFICVLAFFVIPIFSEIAPVEKWIGIGKAIYTIAYVITNFWWALLIAVSATIFGFRWSLLNWTGTTRVAFDRYLPYRLSRDNQGAIFLVSLATMLKAGDGTEKAFAVLRSNASPWLRWHINRMSKNLTIHVDNPGEVFNTGLFSQSLTNRIQDFARRSGELNVVIAKVGLEGVGKVRKEVEKSATILNMGVTLVMGGVIAFMLVGVLLTSQGLSKSLKEQVSTQQISK